MWSNQKSISVVVASLRNFKPPYCPNEKCPWHQPVMAESEGVFVKFGTRAIRRYPYVSFRFRCKKCRRVFSHSFFNFSYRDKLAPTYEQIMDLRNGGWTKIGIAAFLGCSQDTILRRTRKIARQALLLQAKKTENLKITESVAFDGLENFSFSQYDPNNINHLVGRKSLFVYDFNFSPLNRKGRMSQRQVARKNYLDTKFKTYPGNAIQLSAERIFGRLSERATLGVDLHTDNHYAYRRALKKIESKLITHRITPAKLTRNYRNKLFAINHLDLLTRQKVASYKRETIAFSKHSISMVEDFAIFMIDKNFRRSIFIKKHVSDPETNTQSPAVRVGIEEKILSFRELFKVRVTKAQVKLSEDWKDYVERLDSSSRRPILSYNGI